MQGELDKLRTRMQQIEKEKEEDLMRLRRIEDDNERLEREKNNLKDLNERPTIIAAQETVAETKEN